MNKTSIPSELLDATRSADWRAMPSAIAKYRSGGGSTAGSEFWEKAAHACGCPPHALRQRCSAYEVVTRNAKALGTAGVEVAWSRPYTQLEIIARIDRVDHPLALQLLASPLLDTSVARLRTRLAEARAKSGRASGLVRGHKALSVARSLVARHLESLASSERQKLRFVAWTGGNRFISPSMVAVTVQGGTTFTEALLVTAKGNTASIYKALSKAAFESTFVDRYWIATPAAEASHIGIPSDIARLGLGNVGLVIFDAESSRASVAMDAGRGLPSIDRRALLQLPAYYRTNARRVPSSAASMTSRT